MEFTSTDFEFEAGATAGAISAGAQAQAGSSGKAVGAIASPATFAQAETTYPKGMAVFVNATNWGRKLGTLVQKVQNYFISTVTLGLFPGDTDR